MNLDFWNLRAFLFGALSGVICVGGLHFGMRALMKSMSDSPLDQNQKSRQKSFGILLLVGQFFAAFGVVGYYLSATQDRVILPLAFGLIGSIFVGNLIFAAMRK
jgi:cell division protein FtsX